MIEAYPLYWPQGWKRARYRERSRFRANFAASRDGIVDEIRKLGGSGAIVSTDIPLRNDGLPYASFKVPDDPGVAIYFKYKGKDMSFACDKYVSIQENMRAIQKTIEAIRGIERWGASDMMERAFRGFQALPPTAEDWQQVLGVSRHASKEEIKEARNKLAAEHHPDCGGDANMMAKINEAYRIASTEVGVRS